MSNSLTSVIPATTPYVAGAQAMTYSAMESQFNNILNRTDCTSTLSQTFFQEAITRIEREARLPCMERLLVINPTVLMNAIDLPADFLAPIDVFLQSADGSSFFPPYVSPTTPGVGNTFTPLKHLTYRDLLTVPVNDVPRAYARIQTQLHIRGWVPAGVQTQLLYYGAFTPLTSPASSNELTATAPDLAIYAALSLAADYFQHDAGPAWEQRYQQILQQVAGVAIDVEWSGGPMVIEPSYGHLSY